MFSEEAVKTSRAINARPALGLALRTQAEISGNQLYDDDSQPNVLTLDAEASFAEAVEIFESLGDSLELARTLRIFAGYLDERGAVDKAAEQRVRADTLVVRDA